MTYAIKPYIFYPDLTQNSALVTSRVYNPIIRLSFTRLKNGHRLQIWFWMYFKQNNLIGTIKIQ